MTDIVRDPYGNPLKRDATITTLRAEVERLKALTVKADEAIERQQQDLDEAADRAADCDILRAENERLRAYALKAFTVVEFCSGEGLLLPHPTYDCDDLLMEGVELLKVETSEEARAALEGK